MFDWVIGVIDGAGYVGIAFLMFLENLFPPIPSEVIMPAAGYNAASGELSLPLVILSGGLGSLAGNMFWYGVGRWIGGERLKRWSARHGRWLTIAPADVERVEQAFLHHCSKAVLFGQLIPTVRTLISVPAGMFRMAPIQFLLFAGVGTLLWTGGLALAGHALGTKFADVGSYMNPITTGILLIIAAGYVYRVVTWRASPNSD